MDIKTLLSIVIFLSPAALQAQTAPQQKPKPRAKAPVHVKIPTVPDNVPAVDASAQTVSNPSDSIPSVDKTRTDSHGNVWTLRFQLQSVKPEQLDALADRIAPTLAFYDNSFTSLPSKTVKLVEAVDKLNPPDESAGSLVFQQEDLAADSLDKSLDQKLAHLWWGQKASAGPKDLWITEGLSRYSRHLYIESQGKQDASNQDLHDLRVGAAIFDSTKTEKRLSDMDNLDRSRIFYQAAADRSAKIFDRLRIQMGDDKFLKMLKVLAANPGGAPLTTDRVVKLAETAGGLSLKTDFEDWVNSVAQAPNYQFNGTVYRCVKDNAPPCAKDVKFVTDLTIKQADTALNGNIRIPLKVDTDNGPVTPAPKVEIKGVVTHYILSTKDRPTAIDIGLADGITKQQETDEQFEASIKVAEDYLKSYHARNQEDADYAGALNWLQDAFQKRKGSSLVYFHIGQAFFLQNPPDLPSAYKKFKLAIESDGVPAWTTVWSFLYAGEILDLRDQKDEAAEAYRRVISLDIDPEATTAAQQNLDNLKYARGDANHKRYQREENPVPVTGKIISAPVSQPAGNGNVADPTAAPVIKASPTSKKPSSWD